MWRLRLLVVLLFPALPAFAEAPIEAQLALQSLKPGERARVEAVLGDATNLPLYRGEFTVDPVKRVVSGKVALTLTAREVMGTLYLRCTPNASHPDAVTLSKAKLNGAPAPLSQPDPSLYRVKLEPAVQKGEQVTLELELKAKVPTLPKSEGGLMQHQGGDYGAFAASPDMVSLVGLMPMIPPEKNGQLFEGPAGVGDLGSFDPSNFMVSVTVPSGWRAVSNGLAMGEVPSGGAVRFAYTVAAARELPVLLLKGAKVATRRVGEVEVEAVLLSEDPKLADRVMLRAGKSLGMLEDRLGPSPYKTLRVVEMRLTNGAGGMEFPGLIAVSTNLLTGRTDPLSALGLDGEQAQMAQLMFGGALRDLIESTMDFTIDHEVAHQYTAMLVGSDPVGDPLADEPLTQHLALLLLEWRSGPEAAEGLRDGQLRASYQLLRMLGGPDGKANRPTHEFESNLEYAALVYGKAPLLFDEQRKVVGDAAWQRTLRAYVEQHRYRWVTSRTLTELAGKLNPMWAKKLEALRVRWWNEAHGDEDVGGGIDLDALKEGGSGMKGLDPKVVEEMEKLLKALTGE